MCVCVCVSKDILAPLRITVEVKHDHSDEKRNTSASIMETSSQPVTRKIYTVDCKLYDSFYPYNHVLNYKIFSYVFFFRPCIQLFFVLNCKLFILFVCVLNCKVYVFFPCLCIAFLGRRSAALQTRVPRGEWRRCGCGVHTYIACVQEPWNRQCGGAAGPIVVAGWRGAVLHVIVLNRVLNFNFFKT